MMKIKLMLLVVIAGLLTAGYRFLPSELQYEVNAQLDKITHSGKLFPSANPQQHSEEGNRGEGNKKETEQPSASLPGAKSSPKKNDKTSVASAYIQRLEDVQLQDEGRVVAILPDDRKGSKHQRFIVRTSEDISVLVAHNIDLAPRVKNIKQGDNIEFYGEYVWNEKGGVVHWTHHDPDGSHVSGWLKHKGITYQ